MQVTREGKEAGQGVAYLDDGTMVVVEGGKRHLGQPLDVVGHQRAADLGRAHDLRAAARAKTREGGRDA